MSISKSGNANLNFHQKLTYPLFALTPSIVDCEFVLRESPRVKLLLTEFVLRESPRVKLLLTVEFSQSS